MSSFEPVRVAIVGCGSIATNGYQPRLLTYKHRVELVGYFDEDRARAEALTKAAGGGKVYKSLDEVLSDSSVEAVLNTTTLPAHHPVSLKAIKAGKHVYSEKPLAENMAQADELIAAAEAKGVKFGSAPSSPLGYEQQETWKRIRAGQFGKIFSVVGNFSCTRLESWHPNADVFLNSGLGVVSDAAPYPLIMMTTILGPVKRVFGFSTVAMPERVLLQGPREGTKFNVSVPDHNLGLLEFESGAKGFVMASWSGRNKVPSFEMQGPEGTIAVNPHNDGEGIETYSLRQGDWKKEEPHPKSHKGLDWGKGVVDLACAIRENRAPRCNAKQGRHILEIASALIDSTKTGQSVEVKSRFPSPEPIGEVAPWDA